MSSLLKIEWLKLKNYRTFWILGILYLISIFGINYIVYRIQEAVFAEKRAKGMAQMIVGDPPYSFPTVWQMTSFVSSFLLFLPGLLLIIFITNEFSFKTHRQNIIDGWSRKQFISVKLLLTVLIAIVSTVMVFLTALFFGLINETSINFENIKYLGYFFIQALSYGLVAVLFALLFKRGGLAIGVFFLYTIVLENLLGGLLNRYANYSGRYLPLESNDNLIPLPVFEAVQKQLIQPPNYTALLIVAIAYIAIYVVIAFKKFEADDL
jgi:ABC-type transport system involved in multi-copper enzyme maturation permease subunit